MYSLSKLYGENELITAFTTIHLTNPNNICITCVCPFYGLELIMTECLDTYLYHHLPLKGLQ